MQKLYCYVDESGQDTKGRLFLVSIVILERTREKLKEKLEAIEKKSKKGTRKWFHTNKERRKLYIKLIIDSGLFKNSIFYSKYNDSKAYTDLTILTTAKAVLQKAREPYTATVLVDGLGKKERHRFAAGLRRLRIKIRKVRGVRDQKDAFIRLADAIAGFICDCTEEDMSMKKMLGEAVKKNLIEKM
jgi:hypothetical protein